MTNWRCNDDQLVSASWQEFHSPAEQCIDQNWPIFSWKSFLYFFENRFYIFLKILFIFSWKCFFIFSWKCFLYFLENAFDSEVFMIYFIVIWMSSLINPDLVECTNFFSATVEMVVVHFTIEKYPLTYIYKLFKYSNYQLSLYFHCFPLKSKQNQNCSVMIYRWCDYVSFHSILLVWHDVLCWFISLSLICFSL